MENPEIRNAKQYVANYAALGRRAGGGHVRSRTRLNSQLAGLIEGHTYYLGSLYEHDI